MEFDSDDGEKIDTNSMSDIDALIYEKTYELLTLFKQYNISCMLAAHTQKGVMGAYNYSTGQEFIDMIGFWRGQINKLTNGKYDLIIKVNRPEEDEGPQDDYTDGYEDEE